MAVGTKDERLYIRTTATKKQFVEQLAEKYTKGNVNALFDKLVEELMEEEGED
ncbi:Uncharacterised protein [Bacillus tequilensis]|uniref:hypothetical protein n=1 Tax=Bacillus tequilensis TaxID=227866 RepID=UPI0004AEACA2|nr:hypothetical protein [Bacillus tequilensis]SPT93287.1 Uncharacterised protein [Bacillus tequilensis]